MQAHETFRRAMLRYEKRAKKLGFRGFGSVSHMLNAQKWLALRHPDLEVQPALGQAEGFLAVAKKMPRRIHRREYLTKAFLWARAADATAKLAAAKTF